MNSKQVKWVKKELIIPESKTNFALAVNGATAKASACSSGFHPDGVINGNTSLCGWGHGNGWQAPSPAWHPNWWGEWIEVIFSDLKTIDTILVHTFPAFVQGRLWRGLRDFQVQYLNKEKVWNTIETISGNKSNCSVIRFKETEAYSIRVWVTRNHYPEEQNYERCGDIHESPRIIEIEAYYLGNLEIEKSETRIINIENGKKGNVAIFAEDGFAEAITSPEELGSIYKSAGYAVTFLDGDEVCQPSILNAENFSLFVHAYGKYAPLGINLFDFLQGGGHLITIGGRAFTGSKQKVKGTWYDLEMDPEITSSAGRYNDSIRPFREQLGIFTIPFSKLKHVQGISSAPGQFAVQDEIKIDGAANGWMACGCTGELLPLDESAGYVEENRLNKFNHQSRAGINYNKSEEGLMWGANEDMPPVFSHPCARWIPLFNAYDEYGRDRGAIGAILSHYEGMYRGSNWAFFGIEDKNIFKNNEMSKALIDITGFLLSGVCLHDLESEFACYKQGEKVRFSVKVDNCSKIEKEIEIKIDIFNVCEKDVILHSESKKIKLQPGSWQGINAEWAPKQFDRDLYNIKAVLYVDGQISDSIENGFVVWDEKVIAKGPQVEFKDNFFHFDGVPRYVVGARDSGFHLPGAPDENALGWDNQYKMMKDFGMQVVSPIHTDWLIPGIGWGEMDEENPVPEVLLRIMEAQAQLAQKHGLIYAPGLFFSYEDQAIKNFKITKLICEQVGRRLAKVPGIIFYLTDDTMKHIPEIFNEWSKLCVDSLNVTGRKYMVTVEFGFRQEWPDSMRHGSKHLTFNAGSCFQRTVGDPVYERLIDMRPAGKSFTLGEFVRRIPAGSPEDFHGYMAPPHLNFGMGYAMSLNWKWRTSYHAIWPSDVVFPGNWIPKDHLYAFRNEALFFRHFKPVYNSPELLVVMPSTIWLKYTDAVTRYLVSFLRKLIEMKVDFACIDDTDLDNLPENTKALIYPIPMEMTDKIYSQIKSFVQSGGSLLITGDISRLEDDKPHEASRKERLLELCGLKYKALAYATLSKGHSLFIERFLPKVNACNEKSDMKTESYIARPWIEIECERAEAAISDEQGHPMVTRASCGNGKVWFTPDISPELPRELLTVFLKGGNVERNEVKPDLSTLHCFKTDTLSGSIYTLITFPWDMAKQEVEVTTKAGKIGLVLKDQALGVVHVGTDGSVNALETQGNFRVNGSEFIETDSHIMMAAIDEKDLRESNAVVVYPITKGQVKIKTDSLDFAEVGEFVNGRWNSYEKLNLLKERGTISFDINNIRSTAWILAYKDGERSQCISRAESIFGIELE